jgi:hypothetical protein
MAQKSRYHDCGEKMLAEGSHHVIIHEMTCSCNLGRIMRDWQQLANNHQFTPASTGRGRIRPRRQNIPHTTSKQGFKPDSRPFAWPNWKPALQALESRRDAVNSSAPNRPRWCCFRHSPHPRTLRLEPSSPRCPRRSPHLPRNGRLALGDRARVAPQDLGHQPPRGPRPRRRTRRKGPRCNARGPPRRIEEVAVAR